MNAAKGNARLAVALARGNPRSCLFCPLVDDRQQRANRQDVQPEEQRDIHQRTQWWAAGQAIAYSRYDK